MSEVQVSVNFNELETRVNRLRGRMTTILNKTKEKLEEAAEQSGLPVTFNVDCKIAFPEVKPKDKKDKKGGSQ